MIPFFRKIRYKLAEDNQPASPAGRFLKYSRYAIGEIVLVVLGILIALQINTWNQDRIIRKELDKRIISLIEDFALDTLLYRSNEENLKEKIITYRGYEARFYSKHANFDTILSIAHNEYVPEYIRIYSLNSTTFNSLESTGEIELFDENLKKRLIQIRQMQEEFYELSDVIHDIYISNTINYYNKYKWGYQGDDTPIVKLIGRIDDQRDFVISFTNVVENHAFGYETILERNMELLNETKKLIVLLDERRGL